MGKYFPDLPARTRAQMGDVDDNPVYLVAEEVFASWPVAFLWGRSNGNSGEHPKGLALDFSVLEYGGGVNDPGPARPAWGNAIAAYLWTHRKRLGVWYIIWNRRIISTNPGSYAYGRWVTYRGSNPHTDHVHVSFYAANVYQPPPREDDDMPTADEIAEAVWAHRLNPGPYAERIGQYGNAGDVNEDVTYSAAGLQVGPDAYGREMHREVVPRVKAIETELERINAQQDGRHRELYGLLTAQASAINALTEKVEALTTQES